MRIFNKKQIAIAGSALSPVLAFSAQSGALSGADNAFTGFQNTVMSWAQGPLGTGLAVTMMLMGAATGVAKNSPMPALSGIAGAAFLNWGPTIIKSLINNGALI